MKRVMLSWVMPNGRSVTSGCVILCGPAACAAVLERWILRYDPFQRSQPIDLRTN
jgi:hypothetical protein